jgi:hypothetical protein
MDLSHCPLFATSKPLSDFVGLAAAFPDWEGAAAGDVVGLHVVATLGEHHLVLAFPSFLFKTVDGGFVPRTLVQCIDDGLMEKVGLPALRAYGQLTLEEPPSMELAQHPGWMVGSESSGVDMRDVLLLHNGAVVANTIHHVDEAPDDPAFFDRWALLSPASTSAHAALRSVGTWGALRKAAAAWARTHLPAEPTA